MKRNRTALTDENEIPQTLRLPESLHTKIKAIAKKNRRSANAEIADRLERSLSPTDNPEVVAMRECFKEELARAIETILSNR